MLLLHYGQFSSNSRFFHVRNRLLAVCDISHTASGNIPLITYIYSPNIIDTLVNILILKGIINDKKHYSINGLKSILFTFLHSANFNPTRTAALQDVTVKDNNIATDCFKEDC
jgi:hypothetical protein